MPLEPPSGFSLDPPDGFKLDPPSGFTLDQPQTAERPWSTRFVHGAEQGAVGGVGEAMQGAAEVLNENPQQSGLYKAGERVSQFGERNFPLTPEEKQSFAARVGENVGAMGPAVLAGVVNPAAGLAIGAAQFGGQGAEEQARAARAAGAAPEQVKSSAEWGGALGAGAGVLPLGVVLKPLERAAPGVIPWATNVLRNAVRSGVVFGTIGEAQEYLSQKIASSYDPKAEYRPDLDRAVTELTAGAILGGAHAGISPRPREAIAPPSAQEQAATSTGAVPPSAGGGDGDGGGGTSGGAPAHVPETIQYPLETHFDQATGTYGAKDQSGRTIFSGLPDAVSAENRTNELNAQKGNPLAGSKKQAETVGEPVPEPVQPTPVSAQPIPPERPVAPPQPPEGPVVPPTQAEAAPVSPEPAISPIAENVNKIVSDAVGPAEGTRDRPVNVNTADDIAKAEQHVAPEPSEAQKESGVYQKGHLDFQGLPVTIETPQGGIRRGPVGEDGKPAWESASPEAYGYIKKTAGADGDHVDTYVSRINPQSDRAFVVDQNDRASHDFDEHKVVLGVNNIEQARAVYDAGFSDGSGPQRRAAITEMSVPELKDWLANGDTTKPFSKPLEPPPGFVADRPGIPTPRVLTDEEKSAVTDAAGTLNGLGYKKKEAQSAVEQVIASMPHDAPLGAGQLVRDTLRMLGQNKIRRDDVAMQAHGPVAGEIAMHPISDEQMTPAVHSLINDVDNLIARIAPGASPQAFSKLTADGDPFNAGYFSDRISGMGHLIAWSLETPDAVGAARHEAIHYLRRAGFLTQEEWKALTDAAGKNGWMAAHDIERRYPDLPKDQQIEEAVAEQFSKWRRDEVPPKGVLGQIYEKFRAFLNTAADMVRQAFGRDVTADEVFSRIESGRVGNRPDVSGRDIEAAFQKPRETSPEEAAKNLGDRIQAMKPPRRYKTPWEAAGALMRHADNNLPKAWSNWRNAMWDNFRMSVHQMSMGSKFGQAVATDYANGERLAQFVRNNYFDYLTKHFNGEQNNELWDAGDASSVYAQRLMQDGLSMAQAKAKTMEDKVGIFSSGISPEMRVQFLSMSHQYDELWKRGVAVGKAEGEGLPWWTPRMAALIDEHGEYVGKNGTVNGGLSNLDQMGINFRTTAPSMLHRKHLTADETEAGMRGALGENAVLVKDIRTMPLAAFRFEKAVAGAELINEIKKFGTSIGRDDLVSDHETARSFTIAHPSFTRWVPRREQDREGAWRDAKDANGNQILERRPLYIDKDFEGPLRAVLRKDPGAIYQAIRTLESKSLGLIMYSSFIHLGVVLGKVAPAMPGKFFTGALFRDGYAASHDRGTMLEAVGHGVVPAGQRYMDRDIMSVVNEPDLTPGRGWAAKIAGALGDQIHKDIGDGARKFVDKFGDVWHHTLLWDRVQDMQMGLYVNFRDSLIGRGYDPTVARRYAAHAANRYAGMIPNEAMSQAARQVLNVLLFSRSFTLGNIGIAKDALTGLPGNIRAQMERDLNRMATAALEPDTSRTTEQKDALARLFAEKGGVTRDRSIVGKAAMLALGTFLTDIALGHVINSLTQSAVDNLKNNQSGDAILDAYERRFGDAVRNIQENPLAGLDPFYTVDSLDPTSEHEPGKQNRVLYGRDSQTGQGLYLRLPFGKVGEDLENWLKHPDRTLKAKMSTVSGPLLDVLANSDQFGNAIYDPNHKGLAGALDATGNAAMHIVSRMVPWDSLGQPIKNIIQGRGDPVYESLKFLSPAVGVTISRGYPGGPEAGYAHQWFIEHEKTVRATEREMTDDIRNGDYGTAQQKGESIGMTPHEFSSLMKRVTNPEFVGQTTKTFRKRASPEEVQKSRQTSGP